MCRHRWEISRQQQHQHIFRGEFFSSEEDEDEDDQVHAAVTLSMRPLAAV